MDTAESGQNPWRFAQCFGDKSDSVSFVGDYALKAILERRWIVARWAESAN